MNDSVRRPALPPSSRAVALLLSLLLVPACTGNKSPESAPQAPGAKPSADAGKVKEPPRPTAGSPLPKAGVVAVVNGTEITEAEFADGLSSTAFMATAGTPEGRTKVVNNLIEQELLIQDARARGLADRPLVRRVIERNERQVLASMSQQRIIEAVPEITDKELDKELGGPEDRLDLTVILTDELKDAERALARIRGGEPFEKVAREVSVAPGVAESGNVTRRGLVRNSGMYPPEVEDALFALAKVGQISAPRGTSCA